MLMPAKDRLGWVGDGFRRSPTPGSTPPFPGEMTGASVGLGHLPYRHAERLDGGWRRLVVERLVWGRGGMTAEIFWT